MTDTETATHGDPYTHRSGATVRPALEPDPPPEPVDLTKLLKAELVAIAESAGVDTDGTKADLIARIEDLNDG